MTPDCTELEWIYEPADFFEAPYRREAADFDLLVEGGRAIASVTVPVDPVPKDLEERVRTLLESIFLVRQLQLHTNYKLEGPRIYQHSSSRKNVSVRVGAASVMLMAGQIDLIVRDAAGNTVRDSRAERIAQHNSSLDQLAPKLQHSAILRGLFDSYSRSIADPDDELVHLYEVRDALSRHYGGEQAARDALAIGKREWQRLGILANVEPLEQSRHRGKHSYGRRPATDAELDEARNLARQWIIAFGQTV